MVRSHAGEGTREPGQIRKEAAVSDRLRVPWGSLAGAGRWARAGSADRSTSECTARYPPSRPAPSRNLLARASAPRINHQASRFPQPNVPATRVAVPSSHVRSHLPSSREPHRSTLALTGRASPVRCSPGIDRDHAAPRGRRGSDRPAYLFVGPRGFFLPPGVARILAKAINCTNRGEDGEPCDVPACRLDSRGAGPWTSSRSTLPDKR